jgi:hypothetical protein
MRKSNLFSVGPPDFSFENALALLDQFREECDFKEEMPSDVLGFMEKLGWQNFQKSIHRELVNWEGGYFINIFLEQCDIDTDLAKEKGIKISTSYLKAVGLTIKHLFAWNYVSALLYIHSDLPQELLLESTNDLECSIFLAKDRFFKQSFQILRNFCEICVSILYFINNLQDYKKWLAIPEWRLPGYREMIQNLKNKGKKVFFSENEARFLGKIYSKLNSSVHQKRDRLNMNVTRLIRFVDFDYGKEIEEWCAIFRNTVVFMIKIYIKRIPVLISS